MNHHRNRRSSAVGLVLVLCVLNVYGCSEDPPAGSATTTAPASGAPSQSSQVTTSDEVAAGDAGGDDGLPDDDGVDGPPDASGSAPPPVPKVAEKPKPKTDPVEPKTQPAPTPVPAQPAPLPEPTAQTPPAPPPVATVEPIAPPAKDSADEIAERIDSIFKPVQRFKAKFNQEYWAKVHDKKKKSKGTVLVLKPGKLSLSYVKPNENRAVSDGTTLKVYEHENKQMFVKNVSNTEYPGAFAFILGKGLRSSFTFEFHKTSKFEGGPVIVGKPRVPNPGYQSVLFYVDESLLQKGDLGCIRRVLVIDAQGNRNRFDFIQAEQPEKIDDKEFLFEPPKGTEIING